MRDKRKRCIRECSFLSTWNRLPTSQQWPKLVARDLNPYSRRYSIPFPLGLYFKQLLPQKIPTTHNIQTCAVMHSFHYMPNPDRSQAGSAIYPTYYRRILNSFQASPTSLNIQFLVHRIQNLLYNLKDKKSPKRTHSPYRQVGMVFHENISIPVWEFKNYFPQFHS